MADTRGSVCTNSGGLRPDRIQRSAVRTRTGFGEWYSCRSRQWHRPWRGASAAPLPTFPPIEAAPASAQFPRRGRVACLSSVTTVRGGASLAHQALLYGSEESARARSRVAEHGVGPIRLAGQRRARSPVLGDPPGPTSRNPDVGDTGPEIMRMRQTTPTPPEGARTSGGDREVPLRPKPA